MHHHFTTPYCPWANGGVERQCCEVIQTSRALFSEWKLLTDQWPSKVDVIQNLIIQSPADRLRQNREGMTRCPMEVFTSLKPSTLLPR